MKLRHLIWLFTTGLMLATPSVFAMVITPVSVEASSTFSSYDKDNLINDSGLSGNLHDTDAGNMWMADNSVTATLIFDLGAIYDLLGTYVWQYNADCCSPTRGVQSFNIFTSLDKTNFDFAGSATLADSSNTGLITSEFTAFNQTAQYVKFSILSNYGSAHSGLSEVKFGAGTSVAVPEVSTTALLLSVLGLFRLRNNKLLG